MKKKVVFAFLLLFFTSFLLYGCAGNNFDGEEGGGTAQGQSVIIADNNRKIIYTAHLSVKSKDLMKSTNQIKDMLVDEDWVEAENLTDNSNHITFRVKTSRLNDFIEGVKSEHETTSFKLESKDVSLDYLDTTARKQSLQNERTRLEAILAETSNYSDIITINRRISEIETELIKLERTLLEFDSLVDYSTVHIWIYGPTANPNPPSYGTRLSHTISAGWRGVVAIAQGTLQIIVFLIPFLVIVVPVGGIVFAIVYFDKKKKADKNKPPKIEEPEDIKEKEE